MHTKLLNSLLELAHATSQNVQFAHRKDVNVSYGEETITETNLLELRRRHPGVIELHTFGKKIEATNGADWEWHIKGRARTFRMRVQAKRLQQDNRLKIPHVVKSSKQAQIDLLIADAKRHHLMPVYCFYSSEDQRGKWKVGSPTSGGSFEFGCLLASAHKVRAKMPKSLGAIENDCVPWHYLVDRRRFSRVEEILISDAPGALGYLRGGGVLEWQMAETDHDDTGASRDFPTIDDLNNHDVTMPDREGIFEGDAERLRAEGSAESFRERGIARLVEIDVRDIPLERGA